MALIKTAAVLIYLLNLVTPSISAPQNVYYDSRVTFGDEDESNDNEADLINAINNLACDMTEVWANVADVKTASDILATFGIKFKTPTNHRDTPPPNLSGGVPITLKTLSTADINVHPISHKKFWNFVRDHLNNKPSFREVIIQLVQVMVDNGIFPAAKAKNMAAGPPYNLNIDVDSTKKVLGKTRSLKLQ